MIKFNEITWYSRLAAPILFIGILPALTFYIGTRYEEAENINVISIVPAVKAVVRDTWGTLCRE